MKNENLNNLKIRGFAPKRALLTVSINKIVYLSILVIMLAMTIIITLNNNSLLQWKAVYDQSGQIFIYLEGEKASSVLGVDLKLDYDESVLKVVDLKLGEFFNSPILIKRNDTDKSYSIITNPDSALISNPSQPILIITFASSTNNTSNLTILQSSQVYISKTGGYSPKAFRTLLKYE